MITELVHLKYLQMRLARNDENVFLRIPPAPWSPQMGQAGPGPVLPSQAPGWLIASSLPAALFSIRAGRAVCPSFSLLRGDIHRSYCLIFFCCFICFRAMSIKVHFKLVRFKCYSEHLNEEGIQWEVKEKCIRDFEKMFVKCTHLSQVRLFLKINYKGKIRES